MADFMLYRPGSMIRYQGAGLDYAIFDDADLKSPAKDGWRPLGDFFDLEGKFLPPEDVEHEQTAAEIIASIPGLSADELTALWVAENERPKPRKGVLTAVEKAQEAGV